MNFYDSNLGVEVKDDELYHYGRSKRDGAPIGSGRPKGSGGSISIYKKRDGSLNKFGEKRAQMLEKKYENVTGHKVIRTGEKAENKSLRQTKREMREREKLKKKENKKNSNARTEQNIKEMLDSMSNAEIAEATARLKAKNSYLKEYTTLNPRKAVEDTPFKAAIKTYKKQAAQKAGQMAADYTAKWLEKQLREALDLGPETPNDQPKTNHTEHAGKPKTLKNNAKRSNVNFSNIESVITDSYVESLNQNKKSRRGKKKK